MGTSAVKANKQFSICHQKFTMANIINDEQMQIQTRTTLDDYNTWKANLRKINSLNKQNILVPLNHSFEKQGWCSENTGIVQITYDNYQFIFEEELQNRITLDKHLSQQEMWYLLYTLISTAKDFSFLSKKVGDIRPHNIFVSQAGQIKIGVCFSWPNQSTNYQKTLNQKQITYISPEQLQMCRNQKMNNLINSITAESFSIGLTMLHAGLLFNFSSIYNIEKFEMNTKLLEEKIKDWMRLTFKNEEDVQVSYSTSLKQIIRNMCIIDPEKRQSSTQIYKLLQQYKEQILNIEPFTLNYNCLQNHQHKIVFNSQFENPKPSTNTSEFQLYNHISTPNNYGPFSINNTHTQYSIVQPPTQWTRRTLNPIPTTGTSQTQFDMFNRYAQSISFVTSQQNIRPLSQNKLAVYGQNTFNTPPTFYNTSEKVLIKSFEVQNEQDLIKYSHPVMISVNQTNDKKQNNEKKLTISPPPTTSYSVGPVKQFTNDAYKVQSKVHSQQDYSDFLKKIDEQIEKSKNLFPS